MSGATKLAAYAAALAVVFGGAAVAGGAIDPQRDREETSMSTSHASDSHSTSTAEAAGSAHGGAHAADPVRGLAVAQDGLRVVVERPELRQGAPEQLRFRIVDAHGETVRDFDVAHEKRMHLIVARRDLTGFQHLHPAQEADGSWRAEATLPDAGSYRLFADFTREDEAHTLAADLRVDGDADLRPLPAPATRAATDGGETVTLDGAEGLRAGRAATLRFALTGEDGKAVAVEPYLGASGHLVALREGDLAFLHVHPSGDGISFETTFPTAGAYRLFLQVKVDGAVRTAAFTVEVAP